MTNFYRKLEKPYREILTNTRDKKSVVHLENFTEKILQKVEKKKFQEIKKTLPRKFVEDSEKKFTDHRNNFTEKNLMVKSDDTYDSVPKILGKLIEGTTVK